MKHFWHIFGFHYPIMPWYSSYPFEGTCEICWQRIYYSFNYGWLTEEQMNHLS